MNSRVDQANWQKIRASLKNCPDCEKWGQRFVEGVCDELYDFVKYAKVVEAKYSEEYGENLFQKNEWFEKYAKVFELEELDQDSQKGYEKIFGVVYDAIFGGK